MSVGSRAFRWQWTLAVFAVAVGFLAYAAWTFLINWPKTPDKPPQA